MKSTIMSHSNNCKCYGCLYGTEAMFKKRDELMAKYGWRIDYTYPDNRYPNNINIHTHGLIETFSHKDLQICMIFNPSVEEASRITQDLLYDLVENHIRKGVVFLPNIDYHGMIYVPYKIRFIEAFDGSRPVLRLCIPNENNKFQGYIYEVQFTKTSIRR